MGTEIGGYRESASATTTATTHTLDLPKIEVGHKVYIERVSAETSRANGDYEAVVLSGGEEFPVVAKLNLTANFVDAQEGGFWLYPGERLRFQWSGVQSGDTVKGWAVGVDKWDRERD